MEDTGALPQPGSSLGTGLNHCTQSLGEYGYPKKCYLLISSKAQPYKGKQRVQSHRSLSLLLTPSSPSTRPHLCPTEQMVQGTLPLSPTPCQPPPVAAPHSHPPTGGSPLWVLLVLLVGPSCPVLGNYHDVGVVSFVFRLQAWQVCRRWHTPGCGNFPETL